MTAGIAPGIETTRQGSTTGPEIERAEGGRASFADVLASSALVTEESAPDAQGSSDRDATIEQRPTATRAGGSTPGPGTSTTAAAEKMPVARSVEKRLGGSRPELAMDISAAGAAAAELAGRAPGRVADPTPTPRAETPLVEDRTPGLTPRPATGEEPRGDRAAGATPGASMPRQGSTGSTPVSEPGHTTEPAPPAAMEPKAPEPSEAAGPSARATSPETRATPSAVPMGASGVSASGNGTTGSGAERRSGDRPTGSAAFAGLGRAGSGKAGGTTRATTGGSAARSADRPIESQAARALGVALKQKGGTVTLRLAPEALGEMRVQLKLAAESVRARIEVTTKEALGALERSRDELIRGLEAHGVRVDSFEVSLRDAPTGEGPALADRGNLGGGPTGHDHGGSLPQREGAFGSGTGSGNEAESGGEVQIPASLARGLWVEGAGSTLVWRVDAIA